MVPSVSVNALLQQRGTDALTQPVLASELLKRPQLEYAEVVRLMGEEPSLPPAVIEQVEIHLKYEGYIRRQLEQVARLEQFEAMRCRSLLVIEIGLSHEIREKLTHIQPATLGKPRASPGSRRPRSLSSWSTFKSTACSVPIMELNYQKRLCQACEQRGIALTTQLRI